MNHSQAPEQIYKTTLILWAALVFSQLVLTALIFAVRPELLTFNLGQPILSDNPVMLTALAVLSVATGSMAFSLRRKIIEQAVTEQKPSLVQTAVIVGCALFEAITLYGMLLAFVLNYQYFFLFSAPGILGTLLQFPKRGDIHAASYKG